MKADKEGETQRKLVTESDTCSPTRTHTHPGGVRRLGVIFQHTGHAKVGHFAHQVAVYQDVACRQVTVNIAHV